MEEMLTPVPPQPANIDMSVTPLQPVKKSPWLLILSLLLVFALAAAAYFYWQNIQLRRSRPVAPSPSPSPTTTAYPTAISSPSTPKDNADFNGWQTYTNNVRKYSIKYPENWIIDSSKAETSIEDDLGASLMISKGSYRLTIRWPSAYGPGICIFDDQPRPSDPGMESYCEGEYLDIVRGTKRRLVEPKIVADHVQWEIYAKNNDFFVTVPPTTYIAPIKYDEQEIKIMDQILSSYQPL